MWEPNLARLCGQMLESVAFRPARLPEHYGVVVRECNQLHAQRLRKPLLNPGAAPQNLYKKP
jgi:hypothetical protein